MSCHAIKVTSPSLKLCRNYSKKDSFFCGLHQDISLEEHKRRWIQKFLLAADDKPFLYNYDEQKSERILGDLRDGVVVLTRLNVAMIPRRLRFIDTYLLLIENGYATPFDNAPLLHHSFQYISHYLFANSNVSSWNFLAKKILQILILGNQDTLLYYLLYIKSMVPEQTQANEEKLTEKISIFGEFLQYLFDTPTGNRLSWNPYSIEILKFYSKVLGPEHPFPVYSQETLLPYISRIYKQEKQKQKDRMYPIKEELMAITWHPDRFMEWCLDEEEKAENKTLFG
jgi:hypothetical protein